MPPKSTSGSQRMKSKLDLKEAEIEELLAKNSVLEDQVERITKALKLVLISQGEEAMKSNLSGVISDECSPKVEVHFSFGEQEKAKSKQTIYRNAVNDMLECKYCKCKLENAARKTLWVHYKVCPANPKNVPAPSPAIKVDIKIAK